MKTAESDCVIDLSPSINERIPDAVFFLLPFSVLFYAFTILIRPIDGNDLSLALYWIISIVLLFFLFKIILNVFGVKSLSVRDGKIVLATGVFLKIYKKTFNYDAIVQTKIIATRGHFLFSSSYQVVLISSTGRILQINNFKDSTKAYAFSVRIDKMIVSAR